LSPAQNMIVPTLNYPQVYELCCHFPDCEFLLNGAWFSKGKNDL